MKYLSVLVYYIYLFITSVARHSNKNLMKASNLGVVFGPTLMRPEIESVATIVDIKYQNIIVEEMVEHYDMVKGLTGVYVLG